VRLFIALNLPQSARASVLSAIEPLRAAAPALSWAGDAQLHLTIKFLGEQPDAVVRRLEPAIAGVAARHGAPLLELGGIGAFPNFSAPRVVWLGVAPEPRLELIHHEVEVACGELGIPVDGRPFRPHITLARVRDSHRGDSAMLRGLSQAARQVEFQAEVIGHSIDLMRSELLAGGARHTILVSAALRST
jgi:2'-5' RNA ligase